MPHPIHALFSVVVRTFFDCMAAKHTRFKRGAVGKKLLCKQQYGLTTVFGWEGDRHAPIAFIDGCYLLRDRGNVLIHFGFTAKDIRGKIDWYNKEDFLPCLVSRFAVGEAAITIESFADKVTADGNDYAAAYSRLTVQNNGSAPFALPRVSRYLVPLTAVPQTVASGETVTADFAVWADRFGERFAFPPDTCLQNAGDLQTHYRHMRDYWLARLAPLAEPVLPDAALVSAYKAGYIYTQIVKDGDCLHVGENGYDEVFDHDIIGITASLLTMGDFRHFKEYVRHILDHVQYPDARWKYSFPFALYLLKTGDTDYLRSMLAQIRENTHTIEKDRAENGIMKRTNAIDSLGYWTVDNWSALTGLAAYKYICIELGEMEETQWAQSQYDSLLDACNRQLLTLDVDYIPISLTEPNETGPRADIRDANALSMFLFGRWAWDGFLLGARQEGAMLERIDRTYTYVKERREAVSDSPYNFGGYPHGFYCSAYNAGYGSSALRGEKYRSLGIEAYRFMIDHAMSGPFAWWEGVDYPNEDSAWDRPHAAGGGGSCPHMWGQSTATKVLLDSVLAEKTDGTLLLCRGVPERWQTAGQTVGVRQYPVQGGSVDAVVRYGETARVELSGAIGGRDVCFSLHGRDVHFRVPAPSKSYVWEK